MINQKNKKQKLMISKIKIIIMNKSYRFNRKIKINNYLNIKQNNYRFNLITCLRKTKNLKSKIINN